MRSINLDAVSTPKILAFLTLLIFGVYVISPVVTVTDSLWSIYVSASLLREGNINLDEYEHLIDLEDDIRIVTSKGHLYTSYPAATPILAVPFVWAANGFFALRNTTDLYTYLSQHKPDALTGRIEKVAASAIAALSAIPIFLLALLSLDRKRAVLLTLLFAFSTSLWSTASRALWQHGPSVLFLSIALYLTVLAREKETAIQYVGFFVAIAYIIRPNNSLTVIFTSLYVFINHKKYFIRYLLCAGVVAIPFILSNWVLYGAILPRYSLQLFDKPTTPARFFEALAGTLISPARGLFIFTPLFLFSIYGMVLTARAGRLSRADLEPYLLAIILGHWLVISSFYDWDGSWSVGPRYLTDIIPYLVFFLIPVFRENKILPAGRLIQYGLVFTILVSTLIHYRCSTSIYPFLWNSFPVTHPDGATYRDWDWGDLQFLRGLCPEDPAKGQAPACWVK
jgi:hypothetical protein